MARNYVIGVGGTGARCAEAVVYLAAAGIIPGPLEILLIDSDQNNGNLVRTQKAIELYAVLHDAGQPRMPITRGLWGSRLPAPVLFQPAINPVGDGAGAATWHDPNEGSRTFGDLVRHNAQPPLFRRFLDVFYDESDLAMPLNIGYRGRPSIGAIALKHDLERTTLTDPALMRFLSRLDEDLRNDGARVFVAGSVFGGTGAAGIPTIPALVAALSDNVLALENRSKLRYGCAMLTPYFSYPSARDGNRSLDSSRHAGATQASLMNYARVQLPYHHAYLIGAPERPETNNEHAPGGESQENVAHYAEFVAALSAWDFFTISQIGENARELHYADSFESGNDSGVSWQTLPVPAHKTGARRELQKKLVSLATSAYFYRNFLHRDFVNRLDYKEAPWYRNFDSLSLDRDASRLTSLNDFSDRYLRWLTDLETSIDPAQKQQQRRLFKSEGLAFADPKASEQWLGNLMAGMDSAPVHIDEAFHQLSVRLAKIQVKSPDTSSAAGLFVYLLHQASSQFSESNYRL